MDNKISFLVGNLAPNQSYKFQVSAFRKHLVGPPLSIEAQTQGIQLPVITGLTGKLIYEEGTSVHLSWKAPEYPIKKKWVYGVYYAVRMSDLFEGLQCLKYSFQEISIFFA